MEKEEIKKILRNQNAKLSSNTLSHIAQLVTTNCDEISDEIQMIPVFEKQANISQKWIEEDQILPPPDSELEEFKKYEKEIEDLQESISDFQRKIQETKQNLETKKKEQQKRMSSLLKYVSKYPEVRKIIPLFQDSHILASRGVYSPLKKIKHFEKLKPMQGTNKRNSLYTTLDEEGKSVVLKGLHLQSPDVTQEFLNRVVLLSRVKNESVIPITSAFIDNSFGYIVAPYYKNGTLLDWISKTVPKPKPDDLIQVNIHVFEIFF